MGEEGCPRRPPTPSHLQLRTQRGSQHDPLLISFPFALLASTLHHEFRLLLTVLTVHFPRLLPKTIRIPITDALIGSRCFINWSGRLKRRLLTSGTPYQYLPMRVAHGRFQISQGNARDLPPINRRTYLRTLRMVIGLESDSLLGQMWLPCKRILLFGARLCLQLSSDPGSRRKPLQFCYGPSIRASSGCPPPSHQSATTADWKALTRNRPKWGSRPHGKTNMKQKFDIPCSV